MPKYSDHKKALEYLKLSQDADRDMRDAAREAHLFVDKRDGQWEPQVLQSNNNRPRYTFDMTGPIVDQVAGLIEMADFDIKIRPAGGDTTKDKAKTIDGMVRNIENVSNASDIFSSAGANMVTGGIDGWMLAQEYVDDNSFDQDLVIKRVANFVDSVFPGPFKEPDGSDMPYCFVLESMPKEEYEERFPKGSGQSLSVDKSYSAYVNNQDDVIVGQFYFIETKMRELWLMRSGKVLENNDQNKSILDELIAGGDSIVKTRKRPKKICKSRLLDGKGWLTEARDTVFNQVPVFPLLGNFKIVENKIIYRGIVEKLMDPQRVFNYAKSREIEEGALAPRAKYWMTEKQSAGHESTLATMNTNADPVQLYNPDAEAPPPQQQGGATVNPGLNVLSNDMDGVLQKSAGLFDASMGASLNMQSGVAIEKLQYRGDVGTRKFFAAMERAISRTARVLVDAIPLVYDTTRQVRIMNEDGSSDMLTINDMVFDRQTMQMVKVNDLSVGKYDVTCDAGPSFQNRQQETVTAMTEIAAVDPTVLEIGSDVLFNNLTSPGMDVIAQRKRRQLFDAGLIPVEQMTQDEQTEYEEALLAAQTNPPEPDPASLLAMAEVKQAEAKTTDVLVNAQVKERQEARKDIELQAKVANQQAQLQQSQQQMDFNAMMQIQQQQMEQQAQMLEAIKTQAETLRVLRDAMGVDAIMGPGNTAAYANQAQLVLDAQADQV